jgi:hypothetical protein
MPGCSTGTQFPPPWPQGYGHDQAHVANGATKRPDGMFVYSLVDKIVVPKTPGDYVVSWRWDCEQTPQVWNTCADVTIVAGGGCGGALEATCLPARTDAFECAQCAGARLLEVRGLHSSALATRDRRWWGALITASCDSCKTPAAATSRFQSGALAGPCDWFAQDLAKDDSLHGLLTRGRQRKVRHKDNN